MSMFVIAAGSMMSGSPDGARATHVLLSMQEYRELTAAAAAAAPTEGEVSRALQVLDDPGQEWSDGEALLGQILRDGLAELRKRHGLTQAALGKLVGMPQSQVSRLENNLESTTLRVLRLIADRLAERSRPPGESAA